VPQAERRLGRRPAVRAEVQQALAAMPEFREWATLTHYSQSMMWQSVEPSARRAAEKASGVLAGLARGAPRRGSLELDPALEVPAPISNTEIHRQPGGYVGTDEPLDALPGARYLGSSAIYGTGKGNTGPNTDSRGMVVVDFVREHFPGLAPRRILDLGCGIGVASQAIALAFPDAEYHAIDVAPGLLRFGHVLAEQRGVPIHFHQRDAADTRFPGGHFDLVVSNILFHETNAANLPRILAECRRVLAPGGATLHVDVATHPWHLGLADQVMNDWQVLWNGEPFWTGYAETEMKQALVAAGFDPACAFAHHAKKASGVGHHYVFGARA
jgi:SAM-dependent methyltransferase